MCVALAQTVHVCARGIPLGVNDHSRLSGVHSDKLVGRPMPRCGRYSLPDIMDTGRSNPWTIPTTMYRVLLPRPSIVC